MPATAPDPQDWRIQQALVMQRADKDVIAALRETQTRINAQLKLIASKGKNLGIGDTVRRAQLQLAKREIQRELARMYKKIGDIVQARRFEAAANVIKLNQQLDAFKLATANVPGGEDVAQAIADAELDAARSGLDRMIARVNGSSYVPLSQRVYVSQTGLNGKVDRLVNSALARGLSAVEFAREVKDFINPNTPGGVRYAALRLARTEINNAAHALAVDSVQDKPWVETMTWHLSGSHPRVDVCDSLAKGGPKGDGRYPKTSVPAKPHPHCFCYVTPDVPDDEEFLDNLINGKYNSYIDRYRNIQPGEVVTTRSFKASQVQAPPAPVKKAAPAKATKPKPAPAPKKVTPAPAPVKKASPRATPKPAPTFPHAPLLNRTPRLKDRGLVGRSADIDFDVQNTNPKYRQLPNYDINCVHVVNAFELRARGLQVTASALPDHLVPSSGRSAQEALNRWVLPDGSKHGRTIHGLMTVNQVTSVAASWPEGARGWLRVSWKGGGGHIINVEKVNGVVRYVDAQNQSLAIDFGRYKQSVQRDGWSIVRVDDLEPTDSVVEFIESAVR